MLQSGIEMTVLVKNRAIKEYVHKHETFIEGRAGSNYEIEISNHTAGRVEAVISVDGLAVTSGKAAGPDSIGYLIPAFGKVRIPGWLLNTENAAKFAFSGRAESYAANTAAGDTRNNGVIGMLVYAERQKPIYNYNVSPSFNDSPTKSTPTHYYGSSTASYNSARGIQCSATANNISLDGMLFNANSSSAMPRGIAPSNVQITASAAAAPQQMVQQSLGTAFGDSTDFRTKHVPFDRADMICMASLYYDNAKGLRERGIDLRPKQKKLKEQRPMAFPGLGCQPPAGWHG